MVALVGENLTTTLALLTRQGPVRPVDLLPLLPAHQRPADGRVVAMLLRRSSIMGKHGIRKISRGIYGPCEL